MIKIRQRNQQIIRLRQSMSRQDVALMFGLSTDRIAVVEKEFRAETTRAERRAKIREELRQADDPEKSWVNADLIDALRLSLLFRKRLLDHFEKIGKKEMSLRELMDWVRPPKDPGALPPLLEIEGVGMTGFRRVIREISDIEMGPACKLAWYDVLLAKIRAQRVD